MELEQKQVKKIAAMFWNGEMKKKKEEYVEEVEEEN